MGIYYRSLSRQVLKTPTGDVHYTNFHGKAPGVFSENRGAWNRFLTRASKTADAFNDAPRFVMMAENGANLREHGNHSPVAYWSGGSTMADNFWDNRIVGHVEKVDGRWTLVITDHDRLEKLREANAWRMAA